MNKPEYYKLLGYTDVKKYLDFIHTNKLDFEEVLKYDRDKFFIGSKTCFLIERFENKNPSLYQKFLDISEDFYLILKEQYGNGLIYNLQFSLLPSGGKVLPHSDNGLGFRFSHRIHIPIITNQNVIFTIDLKDFYFQKGQILEINNKKEHSVKNLNTQSFHRIHIILDYLPLIYKEYT